MSSQFQSGDKDYLILFDILEKQREYCEKKLLRRLIKKGIIDDSQDIDNQRGKLRAIKSYAKKCILKSLRFIHTQRKELEQKVSNHLENARILGQKGLIQQSKEEIKEAKSLAKEFELHTQLIEITRLEIETVKSESPKNTIQKITVLHEEVTELIHLHHLENTFDLLISELEITYRNRGRHDMLNKKVTAQLDELMKTELFDMEQAQKSIRTNYSYYYIWGYYYLLTNQIELALQNFGEVIKIWNAQKSFITTFSQVYMGILSNYLNVCILANKMDKNFLTYLNYLKGRKRQNNKEKAFHFQIVEYLKLSYYLNIGELEEAKDTVNSINTQIDKYRKLIPTSRIVAFYNNILSYYFLMENYREASNYVFKLMNDVYRNEQREDLQARIKTFNLIFEYETCSRKEFFTRVESVSNSLKYYKLLNPFTNLIFRHLILISLAYNNQNEQERILRFYAQLTEYKETIGEKNLSGLGIEEVELWLKSKIEKRPIKDVYLDSLNIAFIAD